jgi:HEAT repeat protein
VTITAEAALLAVLANPVNDYDRINANAALGQCGTAAAIPALAAQVHHPTDSVKCSAIYALALLGDESQLPVFLDALTDRSWAAKRYAMSAIARHGNEHAIAPVCARVRVILGRQRKRQQGRQSELISALEFLTCARQQHSQEPDRPSTASARSACPPPQ